MTAAIAMPAERVGQERGSRECLRAAAGAIGRVRTELLRAFLEQMNEAQIRYCLLNGFQGYPQEIPSDVDFMVPPKDAERVAPILMQVAERCGALLVQAIRHETGAWYFVLAKQVGNEVAYLHPDCTTDYRRDGRLWLEAEPLLDKRRRYKSFFVPAIADEFLYYMIKKVLKQQITREQLQRLAALHRSCPEECHDGVRRFWSDETVRAVVAALLRRDAEWLCLHMSALLAELRASDVVESWWGRVGQYGREWRRRLERAIRASGLSLSVIGGTVEQRDELARALEESLRPAFRRTMIRDEATDGDGLGSAPADWLARVRSTLVIRKRRATTRGMQVVLDSGLTLEQNLERATRATLEYLAARLQRRIGLDRMSPAGSGRSK